MDARADDAATLAHRLQRRRHKIAIDGEDNCRVERGWGRLVRSPGPGRADRLGERLGLDVARAREGEHRSPLPGGDPGQDVGRSAEAVEPQPLALARDREGTPADQAGAQQGGQRGVSALLAQGKREPRVGDHRRGEASVPRVAGKKGAVAEVLALGDTVGTDAAGVAEPRHTDPLPHAHALHARAEPVDPADDLVPGNNG